MEKETQCDHQCSGNCRRRGCNCLCGEWQETPNEKIFRETTEKLRKIPPIEGQSLTANVPHSVETPTEEWENEFDEMYYKPWGTHPADKLALFKSFIRSLRTTHDAELRRKIEAEENPFDPVVEAHARAGFEVARIFFLRLLGKENV